MASFFRKAQWSAVASVAALLTTLLPTPASSSTCEVSGGWQLGLSRTTAPARVLFTAINSTREGRYIMLPGTACYISLHIVSRKTGADVSREPECTVYNVRGSYVAAMGRWSAILDLRDYGFIKEGDFFVTADNLALGTAETGGCMTVLRARSNTIVVHIPPTF